MSSAARDGQPSDSVPNDVPALRVLIVEDHADGAESLAMLLRIYGHDVAISQDGQRALDKAQVYQPDVVLLDLGLPGMHGHEVAKKIVERQSNRKPFLIALTGYGRDEDRRRSAEAGIDLHLLKPADPEQLRCVLDGFKKVIGK
jgi:CheY-like chemotaxis protein